MKVSEGVLPASILGSERCLCLYSEREVQQALDRLAESITDALGEACPLILTVMVGGLIPVGHLLTRLKFPLEIDYVHATRYGHALTGTDLHWKVPFTPVVQGRTVLVVDDVFDGGLTLSAIVEHCRQQGAADVRSCVMVNKLRTREPSVCIEPDFVGLHAPDAFLIGFGLDYHGYWRNAGGIHLLNPA